jgi:hypothetical protein
MTDEERFMHLRHLLEAMKLVGDAMRKIANTSLTLSTALFALCGAI